ncbi:MAG: YceI family protein [Gracilimonas sp.]|nr:YceI family protein [Gracilimonas sp.]
MKYLLIPILFLFCCTEAYTQSFYTEDGTAIFHSEVPLHTFSGQSDYLTGKINLENGIVDFYIDLTTLETGISKRDRDMKETLETDKYPFAEFYGEMTTPFDPDSTKPQNVTVKGTFKIHGVEKETTYSGTLQKVPEGLKLEANWILRLEDYDIVPPSLLFVKVDQEQKIEINALLSPVEN